MGRSEQGYSVIVALKPWVSDSLVLSNNGYWIDLEYAFDACSVLYRRADLTRDLGDLTRFKIYKSNHNSISILGFYAYEHGR